VENSKSKKQKEKEVFESITNEIREGYFNLELIIQFFITVIF